MTTLSLQQAADAAGVSKSTIFRAIRAGRLSAPRDDDGHFAIQPAELFRVYAPRQSAAETVPEPAQPVPMNRAATAPDPMLAALEREIEGLKERLADLRQERDRWAAQAERLALPQPSRRNWWSRLTG